jgi:hypothetical protein
MKGHEFIKTVISNETPNKEQIQEDCHRLNLAQARASAPRPREPEPTVITLGQAEMRGHSRTAGTPRKRSLVPVLATAAAFALAIGTVSMLNAFRPDPDSGTLTPATSDSPATSAAASSTTAVSIAETPTAPSPVFVNQPGTPSETDEDGWFITVRDGWIYRIESNMPENYSGPTIVNLVRTREDGSDKTILDANINFAGNIIVPGNGWVYYWRGGANNSVHNGVYTNERHNGIFRVREDGTGRQKLTPASSGASFMIVGDRLFYYTAEHRSWECGRGVLSFIGNLYSMNLDGSDIVTVVDFDLPAQFDAVELARRDWIEENLWGDVRSGATVGTAHFGWLPQFVFEDDSFDWDAYFEMFPPIRGISSFYGLCEDGWIYFYDGCPDGYLMRVLPDGSEKQQSMRMEELDSRVWHSLEMAYMREVTPEHREFPE